MSNFSRHAIASMLGLAVTAAWAAPTTLRIEGNFTQEFLYTNGDGPTREVLLPFAIDLSLQVDPMAPVTPYEDFFGDRGGAQTHASTNSQSTAFRAPDPRIQLPIDRQQQRLGKPFNQTVYDSWGSPSNADGLQSVSRRVVTPSGQSYTSWDVRLYQSWGGRGIDGPGDSPGQGSMSEVWEGYLDVTLRRPANYTFEQTSAPMTDADLAGFLNGFHEAGGTIDVSSSAFTTSWVTEVPEANSEWGLFLSGSDFKIAAVTPPPIPEPSSIALLAAGLGVLAWHGRRLRKSRPSVDAGAAR